MEGYFDGASRGNPGKAGAGALLINEDGKIIWEASRFLGEKTNNEAEYMALIMLLKAAKDRGIKSLRVYGDSKLVVSQISRQWKINLPHLRLLAREAWDLAEGMDITYSWIPREENKRADMLSNEGIDGAK
ncbi:MAG TPA: ribonuclease HI family protein [Synergistaceae bacterium]|jgi:ribonuclease HI|nr:ribonuclease HI family protein [Synergistaceae bacterium]NLL40827.1 ribonuclease HI family protein [Synergistaceae bacterium]HPX04005.1 ribonuclease HI family protein [Synergistaceae bacterium]HQA54029.1 ribonuclease HI family protein [Synergistaceae bacterium]